jgi:hypothetical protein
MNSNQEISISQKIAERIRARLNDKIIRDEALSNEYIPVSKEDTILNFLVDRTLEDAIENPNIFKLIKIRRLAEGVEEWKQPDTK